MKKNLILFSIIFFQLKFFESLAGIEDNKFKIKTYITNPSFSDGFGSQFQTIIAAVIYAELNNYRFVYTPFQSMEHNYTNDPDFLAKKEKLINFIKHFKTIDAVKNNPNCIVNSAKPFKQFFDSNIKKCSKSKSLRRIKRIFRANKNIKDYFDDTKLNIAVHLRRPNAHDSRTAGANVPDTVFLNIINQLRLLYGSKNPLFHIYSQGNPENFKVYEAEDTVLHLNESIEKTFTSLVLADILVTSPSSFSYVAGLLSKGIVYHIPFWHSPLPHWISIDRLLKQKIEGPVFEPFEKIVTIKTLLRNQSKDSSAFFSIT